MFGARRHAASLLLGMSMLAMASLLELRTLDAAGPLDAALVQVHIEDPHGRDRFDGSVAMPARENTVLDALEQAGREHGFTVRTVDYSVGTMVVQIFEYRNDDPGPCGWVYEVDGEWATQGAADYRLRDGQRVDWFWSCHG